MIKGEDSGCRSQREKVNLTNKKRQLVFEGEGDERTTIQLGDHCNSLVAEEQIATMHSSETASFTSATTDVVFKWITFKNTIDDVKRPKAAIALLVSGDKTSFYGCSFIGVQYTLSDQQGRHYFKDCNIVGAVDFIYGNGQSIYETCHIMTIPGLPVPGWITAHGRDSPLQSTGFVFKNYRLSGSSKVFLGRAWGRYSRVIFYKTYMEDIIVPAGWDSWLTPDKGVNTSYGEHGCMGPGANSTERVP